MGLDTGVKPCSGAQVNMQGPGEMLLCSDLCNLFVPIPASKPQDYTVGNLMDGPGWPGPGGPRDSALPS